MNWETVPFCICEPSDEAQAKLQPGDIVFARTGATTGKSFLLISCPDSAIFASYLIRVRPSHCVSSAYLAHFFQSTDYWRQIISSARGAAQTGVNATVLKGLTVPIPPLLEQRRIAAILDQAEALRSKRRQALAKLDTLTQSLFLEMFGEPNANLRQWPRVPLSDLLDSIESGTSPVCLDRVAEDAEWGVLKLGAVTRCYFDERANKALPAAVRPTPKHEVKVVDLLLTRKNTLELVGAVALVRHTRERLLIPDFNFSACDVDGCQD